MSEALRAECEKGLETVAKALRAEMPRFVTLHPDGSGSPAANAMRDLLLAFPCTSDVLLIDAEGFSSPRDAAQWWTLIRFDLSRPRTNKVRFAAQLTAVELPSQLAVLEQHFGEDADSAKAILDLTLVADWDDPFLTLLLPLDIRTQGQDVGIELAWHLNHDTTIRDSFVREIDYNSKYGLQPDTVLSSAEMLKVDPTTALFTDIQTLLPVSLEGRQRNVAGVQLIPQVPESVRRVVHRAKRLYIFGYFEYDFYTVAVHYAAAAMEAALHARWSATLPRPSILRYDDKKKGVEEIALDQPSHTLIKSHCKRSGWNVRKLFVNGEQFPFTSTLLLQSLRRKDVINDWQQKQYKELWIELRNCYSHLEFCPVESPAVGWLVKAVHEINTLFDSLPVNLEATTS